jgi:hypothetical protein
MGMRLLSWKIEIRINNSNDVYLCRGNYIVRPYGTFTQIYRQIYDQRLKPLARIWVVPTGGASVKDLSSGQIQRAARL